MSKELGMRKRPMLLEEMNKSLLKPSILHSPLIQCPGRMTIATEAFQLLELILVNGSEVGVMNYFTGFE